MPKSVHPNDSSLVHGLKLLTQTACTGPGPKYKALWMTFLSETCTSQTAYQRTKPTDSKNHSNSLEYQHLIVPLHFGTTRTMLLILKLTICENIWRGGKKRGGGGDSGQRFTEKHFNTFKLESRQGSDTKHMRSQMPILLRGGISYSYSIFSSYARYIKLMETLSFSICLIATVCFFEQWYDFLTVYKKPHMDAFIFVKNTHAGFDVTRQHILSMVKQCFRLY